MMINLDGSTGEGGGQILRSSLTLSALTGQAFCLYNIRANRPKPGLSAQHLTAVNAIAQICNAHVMGNQIKSMTLEFTPQSPPQGGKYLFDVAQTQQGGSAGAISLVLQTILLPLACADQDSEIILKGGTHVPFSPSIYYLENIYLPTLNLIGIEAKIDLKSCGWYPKGGGEIKLKITGKGQNLLDNLGNLNLINRGSLKQIKGVAIATNLPDHIPERMALTATKLLKGYHPLVKIKTQILEGIGEGTGIFFTAEYQKIKAGFSALGKRGLSSEKVAEIAVKDFIKFHQTRKPIDQHLADQLLLPLVFSQENSYYQVEAITQHLITNAWVIEQFGLAKIDIDHQFNQIEIKI